MSIHAIEFGERRFAAASTASGSKPRPVADPTSALAGCSRSDVAPIPHSIPVHHGGITHAIPPRFPHRRDGILRTTGAAFACINRNKSACLRVCVFWKIRLRCVLTVL
jgi:hypothetical protein